MIPSIIAAVVAFIVVALDRLSKASDRNRKTSDGLISGTIEIRGIQENLSNIKSDTEKSFDRAREDVEKHNIVMNGRLDKIDDKLGDISSTVKNLEWRTDKIEQKIDRNGNGNGNGKNGGVKSAI